MDQEGSSGQVKFLCEQWRDFINFINFTKNETSLTNEHAIFFIKVIPHEV